MQAQKKYNYPKTRRDEVFRGTHTIFKNFNAKKNYFFL